MNFFVVSVLGLIAISTVQARQVLQQVPRGTESLENTSDNYEYKEVILYLTPSEVKALERNNILQKSNNGYFSNYYNKQLAAQKQEETRKTIEQSKDIKPIYETQEETTDKNEKAIDIPIFYPFQLIPLNNNKEEELEKENEKLWIEEIKKQLDEERENAKIENAWNPIALKQNTQQIKNLLQQENKIKPTTENPKLLQKAANNLDNKNVLNVQDFYRLKYDLEQINKNNRVAGLPKQPSLEGQQPLFLYQSQQIKGTPAHLTRVIRPTLQEETPHTVVDIEKHHERETKMFYDANRLVPYKIIYRQ